MKLDQQDKYGKFSIFIAGAYFMRSVVYNTHFLVPFLRTSHFVGRQYELGILHSQINSNSDDQLVLSLCGLGGIGKTQIAIQFAHQHNAVEESYHCIAAKCDIFSTGRLDSFFMLRVKKWLESEKAGRFLMIIDNVDYAEDFLNAKDATYNAPYVYMPKCSHGSILYTTRDREFAKQVSLSSNIIDVSPISELESITLLKKILSSSPQRSPDDLVLLSKKLGHHPLAITQAATYLNTMLLPILEYLRYFDDQQTAMRILKFEAPDSTRNKGWESLHSTWKTSFDRIQERNTLAVNVLALMSFLDPNTIPMFLLAQEFKDNLSLSEAVSTLRSMSLISPNNEGTTYAIHPLIQLFMQSWHESQGARQRFLSMILHFLARLFPEDQYDSSGTSSVLLPHATKIIELEAVSQEDLPARAELLYKVSQCELRRGRLRNAEELAQEAFLINSKLFGNTAREAANCHVHLARVLVVLGKYNKARDLATESFETFQEIDPCSPDTLRSMENLAEVLRHQGQYGEAQKMHEKTVYLKVKVLGRSHPDTLVSLNNLASTYRIQGQWKEAENLIMEVMETRRTMLGMDHPGTLTSMANLASTYMSQGRLEKAEQFFTQVVETRKKIVGVDHPDTLTSINNLASTYRHQGRLEKAEQLLTQVVETRKKTLGVDHPDTLMSMANLALTYMSQGRLEKAEQLFKQVVETHKKTLGVDHPNTIMSMANLASTYRHQGRLEEAEQLFKQVVETHKKTLGVDHPNTITSMANLASTYRHQGRLEEAEQLFTQVVETRKKMVGVDRPDTLMGLANVASRRSQPLL
ncbi:hypothetical protein N7486_009999 [Penicillium sp. IBT 16267x]|nr:hypothetical protein N7486_009999 [Penicillium sp. IBT 16267x]